MIKQSIIKCAFISFLKVQCVDFSTSVVGDKQLPFPVSCSQYVVETTVAVETWSLNMADAVKKGPQTSVDIKRSF